MGTLLRVAAVGIIAFAAGCAAPSDEDDATSGANAFSTPRDEKEVQVPLDQKKRIGELKVALEASSAKDFGQDFGPNMKKHVEGLVMGYMQLDSDPDAEGYSFAKAGHKSYVIQTSASGPKGKESRFYLYDAVLDGAGPNELKPAGIGICWRPTGSETLTCKTVKEGGSVLSF